MKVVAENNATVTKLKARRRRTRLVRVLLVDADEPARRTAEATLTSQHKQRFTILSAASLAEARRHLAQGPIDLVVVDAAISNNTGLAFAAELAQAKHPVQAIVTTDKPTVGSAVAAIRAGVCDFVAKPFNPAELNERVNEAINRGETVSKQEARVRRLRRICRKLDSAREEVSHQVDILCNDLVVAYQELADQMQHVVETSEYAALLKRELDLERVLHQTLEYILEKAGPTNAAIFLPVTMDEFTLGGYVNYDCADGSPELLLNHLSDVVAPRVGEHDTHVHLTENDAIRQWIGDDAEYLTDCHMLAFPCWTENEVLAVMVLFRDSSQPFSDELVATCNAITPMLAAYLAKIVRVHHRHIHEE